MQRAAGADRLASVAEAAPEEELLLGCPALPVERLDVVLPLLLGVGRMVGGFEVGELPAYFPDSGRRRPWRATRMTRLAAFFGGLP